MSELSTTLQAIGVAIGTIVIGILGVVAVHAPKLVKTLMELAQQRLESLRTTSAASAMAVGVASAEEAGRTYLAHDPNKGSAKMRHAIDVARAIAPRATSSLASPQLTELAQAAVATHRASLPMQSISPPSLAPGSVLSIPVQVMGVDSLAPTPPPASSSEAESAVRLPRPGRLPTVSEARDTPDPRRRREE